MRKKNKTEMQPLGLSSSNLVGSQVQVMVGPLKDPTDLGIRAPREGTWRLVLQVVGVEGRQPKGI